MHENNSRIAEPVAAQAKPADCPSLKTRDQWCDECGCFAVGECWRGTDAADLLRGIGMTDKAG